MCVHTYIHTYMHACMHACMHAYIHTCIHTYIHACMHACIHTYIHIYIYRYIGAWLSPPNILASSLLWRGSMHPRKSKMQGVMNRVLQGGVTLFWKNKCYKKMGKN